MKNWTQDNIHSYPIGQLVRVSPVPGGYQLVAKDMRWPVDSLITFFEHQKCSANMAS